MRILIATMVGSILAGGVAPVAADEWVPGHFMGQALGEIMGAVRSASNSSALGYDDGVCLVGALLQKKARYQTSRRFEAGVEYVLAAGGDEDARDIDIAVVNAQGEVLVEDKSRDRSAAVAFCPERSGTYTVRLELYDAARESFCSFAILRPGGFEVPTENLLATGSKILVSCDLLSAAAAKNNKELYFQAGDNNAAIWGSVLRANRSIDVNNMGIDGEEIVLVGAGDTQVEDLDLELSTSRGTLIAKDVKDDALPLIHASVDEGQTYSVKLSNAAPNSNPTFSIFAALKIVD